MYITDYYQCFVVGYALRYDPFAEDYQRTIMASQVKLRETRVLVGRVGLEPT